VPSLIATERSYSIAVMLEVISVHFAKAAGTSLYGALLEHYGSSLHVDGNHDPCNPSHNVKEPVDITSETRAVHGHFRADRYAGIDGSRLITFLREPVDKLLSVYFFWKSLPPSGNPDHDRFLNEKPSIIEYARQSAGIAFPAYFGDFDMRGFDFIGFYDRRREELFELSKLLGFQIDPDLRLNVTPLSDERIAILGNSRLLKHLRLILQDDIEFYETVLAQRRNGYLVPTIQKARCRKKDTPN